LGKININDVYKDFALLIDGSYSLTALVEDKKPILTAIRDPLGFKPLCIGENKDGYFIASESVAFSEPYIDARFVRDVNPGEAIIIDHDGLHSNQIFKSERHAHCMFEWVYFSRPDSVIEGVPVYKVRKKLGEYLVKEAYIEADYVIPIPDSGRGAAIGYSQKSKIPLEEGFQLDRYQYQRIFILPEQTEREKKATKKLNVLPSAVKGKKIVIVDDSIVRGTNMRKMCISKLRKAGAKEIHVRVSCPPLVDRCPYGIDFHQGELIASKHIGKDHKEICKKVGNELGADSLYYNTIQDLINSLGLPKEELCLGCLTSNYPNITR
jgi:amidophosphoribosyltransferase